MIRRLGGAFAALALALGVLTATTLPAQADANSYPYLQICNSSNSVGPIKIIDTINSTNGSYLVGDRCGLYYNADNRIRIDPDPELGADVDSTWWDYEWQTGYTHCDPGEGLIDPPNYYTDDIYYNTDKSGC